MAIFGFVKKNDLMTNLRILLGANGVNFDTVIANAYAAGQEKVDEAKKLRSQYIGLKNEAAKTKSSAISEASKVLNESTKCVEENKKDAKAIRVNAQELLEAAMYFNNGNKKSLRSNLNQKRLNTLLDFAGIDRSILSKMLQAAKDKEDEAKVLEAKAEALLKEASKAFSEKESAALAAFNKSLVNAGLKNAEATKLEESAKALFSSADFFKL